MQGQFTVPAFLLGRKWKPAFVDFFRSFDYNNNIIIEVIGFYEGKKTVEYY